MHHMRLATVPFVNALPLLWGFRRGPYRDIASIEEIPPSGIPARLRAGTIDLGLVPVIEVQRWSELEILPHLCIAAKRRARSVLLVSRVPVDRIRSVALDENSRTSAALLRILLEHRGVRGVVYHEAAPSLRAMLRDHDAALLIGDPALRADTAGLEVLDLGGEWHAATGLPFVFAVWAIRPGATLTDGLRPFLDSRQMGLANIATIARESAERIGSTPGAIEEYLRVNLHYHLGSEESRGLDLFFRQAHELGLIPGLRRALFHETGEREPARAAREGA
ncbi:MAG TPA: menaquinone biosynthesis protein [Candidatus Polarisedimenticolia bacterium]